MTTAQEEISDKSKSPIQPDNTEECVLVVPTDLFHSLGHFQGFTADVDKYLPGLLDSDQVSYRPRSAMEDDPSFKQLIPYMLFCHQQPDGILTLFQYTRGDGQGESRLHSKRSVGIGGHISTQDIAKIQCDTPAENLLADQTSVIAPAADRDSRKEKVGHLNVYQEGMQRELQEEVVIETNYHERCVGMINDDLTSVGKVHLGVVHRLDVETQNIRANESEIQGASFLPVEEILREIDQFETWSQIVVRALFGSDR